MAWVLIAHGGFIIGNLVAAGCCAIGSGAISAVVIRWLPVLVIVIVVDWVVTVAGDS